MEKEKVNIEFETSLYRVYLHISVYHRDVPKNRTTNIVWVIYTFAEVLIFIQD